MHAVVRLGWLSTLVCDDRFVGLTFSRKKKEFDKGVVLMGKKVSPSMHGLRKDSRGSFGSLYGVSFFGRETCARAYKDLFCGR